MEETYEPTATDIYLMRSIGDGCDIFSPRMALDVRELWHRRPDLITRCDPMGRYDAVAIHPYCGAVLTAAGCAFLAGLKTSK